MQVRAKVRLSSKQEFPGGQATYQFNGVYSSDPNHENKAFTDATPSLSLSITISGGKPAHQAFEQKIGDEFYLDVIPAPKAE